MAGNMSSTLVTQVGQLVGMGGSYTIGQKLYMALATVVPTKAGIGTEASYTGYTRIQMSSGANSTQFTGPDGSGNYSNAQTITFPANSGTSQTVLGWAVFDAATAGNMVFWGPLNASKSIDPSDVPSFPIGTFIVQWS